MTTFGNATTADFDRYAERSFARDLDRYLGEQERAEAAAEAADAEFGEGWEELAAEPDFRTLIPESEVDDLAAEREALSRMLDIEAWEGFGH